MDKQLQSAYPFCGILLSNKKNKGSIQQQVISKNITWVLRSQQNITTGLAQKFINILQKNSNEFLANPILYDLLYMEI